MAYEKTLWANGPAGMTPVSADNLNHIEEGIGDAHDAIDDLAGDIVAVGNTLNAARVGRNYLINGDFSVNQRAFESTTASGIGFDCWRVTSSGGSFSHTSITGTGWRPESSATFPRTIVNGQTDAGHYAYFSQPIESVRTLAGGQVTVSFWARSGTGTPYVGVELLQSFGTGGTPSAATTTSQRVTLSTAWTRYVVTLTLPSIQGKTLGTDGNDRLALFLWLSAGATYASRSASTGLQTNTFDFWGVQVEEGPYVSQFERRSYADQLRACQRWFQRHTQPALRGVVNGSGLASYLGMQLPVPMRAAPTITLGAGGLPVTDGTATTVVTGLAGSTASAPHAIQLNASAQSGTALTANRPAVVYQTGTANQYLDLSADL